MKKKFKKTINLSVFLLLGLMLSFSLLNFSQFTPILSNNAQLIKPPIPNNKIYSAQTTDLEDIVVTKTEAISMEYNAIGELQTSATSITIDILNNQTEDVKLNFFDRVEAASEIETSKDTPYPELTNQHGLLLLNWTDLEINAKNTIELQYLTKQDKEPPINISVSYMIDGVPSTPERQADGTFKLESGLYSNVTISVRLTNTDEGLFVATKPVQPITVAMITMALPSDLFGDPKYSTPPIMENEISGVNQITFAVLITQKPVEVNMTAQIVEGGGWGLIELEPLRVDLIRSPEMFYTIISAINTLLGIVTGLEGYWSYLTIESMLDQITLLTPLMELLTDILVTDYTVFNNLLNSLITVGGYSITEFLDNMMNGPGLIRNLISLENTRQILNSSSLIGYPDGEDLILNELDLIENSTVQAIGSEMLALIGSPAEVQLYNYSLAENNTWDSSIFNGNLSAITISNDLNYNLKDEIVLAYNWTKNSQIFTNISIFEKETDSENYTNIWNSPPLNGSVSPNSIGTGDFDQDNYKELFVGLTDNAGMGNLTIFEFKNLLNISDYDFYNISFKNGGISSLLIEDGLNLDNDTNNEFVVGLDNGSVYIINGSWNSGSLNWSKKWSTDLVGSCKAVSYGDTDQDTRTEIMCSNGTQISIFENTSIGFRPLKNLTNNNRDLKTADSDSDNLNEIITCNSTWINVFEPDINVTMIEDPYNPAKTIIIKVLEGYTNTAAINYSSSVSNSTEITNFVLGDFDLDGKQEIIAATENGSIFFYENFGNNKYTKTLEYTLNTTQYGIRRITTGDVDGDGYSDIILMGQDNKFHVILKPFNIYDLSVYIYANLTRNSTTTTNLYVKIDLKNVLINYPVPHLENLSYVYNGTGPSLYQFIINTLEVVNSTDNYHCSVANEISQETPNPLSGVIGVWDSDEFNLSTGQPYPTAVNYYDPGIPGQKGSFEGRNITTKISLDHPNTLVVNYSYYLIPDPLAGLNLTTIPPYNYSFPGSNSTIPAIYPFIAYLFDTRTSPLVRILGNLTTSLSKQLLVLNSTINPDIGPYKPIIFEAILDLVDIFSIFDEILNYTNAPFDSTNPLDIPIPENIPIDTSILNEIGDVRILSRLKFFTSPRIHARFVTNISLFGNFSYLNQVEDLLSLQSNLGLGNYEIFNNYTQYSDFPKGLDLKPILIKDINNDGNNDTIVAVNGFYPTYEIRALNGSDRELLWDSKVMGPIINMTFEGDKYIKITALNIDNQWIRENETQNSTVYTKNIIENQTSINNKTVVVNYKISIYDSNPVIGVWNRSEFNFTSNQPISGAINYYNESDGAYFNEKTIHLSTELASNHTDLVINYTKQSDTTVIVDKPVKKVLGVWNVSSQTGTNYYPGGSAVDYLITLGTALPVANSTVWIKYYYYSNASSYIYILNYTGHLIDARENMLNQTLFFNGTTYINHTYLGADLGVIQTPYIVNCSNALNNNSYLLLVFTENDIYAINGTLQRGTNDELIFNNTANQNLVWQIAPGFIGANFRIIDTDGDGNNELLFVDNNGILFSYDLKNGTNLWHINQNLGTISTLKVVDLDNDGIKEIVVGSTNQKVYVFRGNTGEFLWSYKTDGSINDITFGDINKNGRKEIIAASDDGNINALNNTDGSLLWKYNITGKPKSVSLADMTNNDQLELIVGSSENLVFCANITNSSNITILWNHTISGKIPIFQFSRTSDQITLQYDLSDRIFESIYSDMGDILGSTLGIDTSSGSDLGLSSMVDLGTGGMDVDLQDLANVSLPDGIGLLNLMIFQIQTIISLDQVGQVTRAQREFTGKPEVRKIGHLPKDVIVQRNTTEFFGGSNHNLTWFEILNNDSQDLIRLNYFVTILKDDNGSIPMNRCRFYMWNGAEYLDIMDNRYYNMTLDMLDLTYINETGEMRFRPFIEINPYDQVNATVDWKGRPIFIEVVEFNGTLNITYWADVSLLEPGVTYEDVSTTISYSYTYPVFQVYLFQIPQIPFTPTEPEWWEQVLVDPLTYIFFAVFFTLLIEMLYLSRREKHQLERMTYKNMTKWLKRREKNWRNLVKKGIMTQKQYNQLIGLRVRLSDEVRPRWYTEYSLDKIKKNELLDMTFSAILLTPFWRKLGEKNRLAKILNDMVNAIFMPGIDSMRRVGGAIKQKLKKKPKPIGEAKDKSVKKSVIRRNNGES
ncbi:MAG: FG-GAP-like repeat-containing protein [Candidatus Helarchaeota archaeon]